MVSRCFALFLLTSVSGGEQCTLVARRLIESSSPSYNCIADASRLHPSTFFVLVNGSCLMFDVCSAPITSRSAFFPLFGLLPKKLLLLLRTRTEGSVSPFWMFKNGMNNASFNVIDGVNGTIYPYRSPLLSEHPNLFSRIHLVLSDDSKVNVNLKFRVNQNSDRLTDENVWFSQNNIEESYPWSLEKIKADSFHTFLIEGLKCQYYSCQFRFYMKLNQGVTCSALQGYMIIVEVEYCDYQKTSFSTSYQWIPDDGNSNFYLKNRKFSLEFRLYGELAPSVRWYERISVWNCTFLTSKALWAPF